MHVADDGLSSLQLTNVIGVISARTKTRLVSTERVCFRSLQPITHPCLNVDFYYTKA